MDTGTTATTTVTRFFTSPRRLLVPLGLAVALIGAQQMQAGVRPVQRPAQQQPASPVVNLNTATVQQLALLPGIGAKLAARIADYRTLHGPFVRVADLRLVPGFGSNGKRLAKLSPYAMVSGPTTATSKIKTQGRK